jgi:hypothetical protein
MMAGIVFFILYFWLVSSLVRAYILTKNKTYLTTSVVYAAVIVVRYILVYLYDYSGDIIFISALAMALFSHLANRMKYDAFNESRNVVLFRGLVRVFE